MLHTISTQGPQRICPSKLVHAGEVRVVGFKGKKGGWVPVPDEFRDCVLRQSPYEEELSNTVECHFRFKGKQVDVYLNLSTGDIQADMSGKGGEVRLSICKGFDEEGLDNMSFREKLKLGMLAA